jgi:hypothetical protein
VAGNMDDYPFGITSDDAVFAEYEVTGTECFKKNLMQVSLTFPITAGMKEK